MAKKNEPVNVHSKFLRELNVNIRSSLPIIQINTAEESRVDSILSVLLNNNGVKEAFEWSCTTGFSDVKTGAIIDGNVAEPSAMLAFIKKNTMEKIKKINDNPNVEIPTRFYVIRDITPFFSQPKNVRYLREIAKILPACLDRIIITTPIAKVPQELEVDITRIELDFPKEDEISEILDETLELNDVFKNYVKTDDQKQKIVSACLGLSKPEIEGSLCKALYEYHKSKEIAKKDEKIKEVYEHVLEYKAGIVKKNGILEYIIPDASAGDVGGLKTLKDWLTLRSGAYSVEAKEYGLPTPKGAILLGIPGTGKSLCAKAAASILGVPLIRLDVGKVFGSLVGESEAKMQSVLKTLEAIGTAILFIDEMDKAFAGVGGSGSGDSGTSKRVFGTFLTWLQEKKANIFVLATVNNASNFPPELLRKGRFDEIFYVGLPSEEERKEIFKIHIEKKKRIAKDYDIELLAKTSEQFTGAEIECAVSGAMYRAFYDNKREFNTEDILAEIDGTRPMAKGMEEQINVNIEWAKNNAKFANEEPVAKEPVKEEVIGNVKGGRRNVTVD